MTETGESLGVGETISAQSIRIPKGEMSAPSLLRELRSRLGLNDPLREQNGHNITHREFNLNGVQRRIELLHQVRPGDCILANFLNTASLELDGKLPMTIAEARRAAIGMRREQGLDASDIMSPDSPLSFRDAVGLFSAIHGVEPKQEDILTVEGRNKTPEQLGLDALNILEYLDTYYSGLVTTGLGYHSRSLKKLEGDSYAIIDPMDPSGIRFANTEQTMRFLIGQTANQSEENNLFFFIRK